MKNIAIFGSGSGTNAEKICSYFSGSNHVNVCLVATNNKNAYIVRRAEKKQIPVLLFSKSELITFVDLQKKLLEKGVEYIVLAGFLLKIPEKMIDLYKNKIINLHPSLLPKYGGKGMYGDHVHRAVLKNKERESGITIHLVNQKYDDGKILFQKSCSVEDNDTAESLAKKISLLEHEFFPKVISNFIPQ